MVWRIRGRGEVTVKRSGTVADPIVFRPAPGVEVTISSLKEVTPGSGGTGAWQKITGELCRFRMATARRASLRSSARPR